MTDSFTTMQNYLQREMSTTTMSKDKREARKLISLVQLASGSDLVEKAKNAGVSYEKYMQAQKLVACR